MTTASLIARIKRTRDPVKMLRLIVENEDYLGYDPYYADIRAALISQAGVVAQSATQPPERGRHTRRK